MSIQQLDSLKKRLKSRSNETENWNESQEELKLLDQTYLNLKKSQKRIRHILAQKDAKIALLTNTLTSKGKKLNLALERYSNLQGLLTELDKNQTKTTEKTELSIPPTTNTKSIQARQHESLLRDVEIEPSAKIHPKKN